MTEHVLLVTGAGASFGARIGLPSFVEPPPLGDALAKYVLQWLTKWSEWRPSIDFGDATTPSPELFEKATLEFFLRFLSEAEKTGIEPALLNLVAQGRSASEQITALNRLLAQAMLVYKRGPFERAPDRYDALLEALDFPNVRVSCITVNYDTLIEEAAARSLGMEAVVDAVSYPGVRGLTATEDRRMTVFKLHGSVNWLKLPGNTYVGPAAGLDSARVRGDEPTLHNNSWFGVDSGVDIATTGRRENTILHLKHHLQYEPILGIYTEGKPAPHNQGCLENVLTSALGHLDGTAFTKAFVVGLHLPPESDDPRLNQVLRAVARTCPNTSYVNPDAKEFQRATELGFQPFPVTFDAFLQDERLRKAMNAS